MEVLKIETVSQEAKMRFEAEENEVDEMLRELDYCLVGRWRGGSNPIPDLKTVRT